MVDCVNILRGGWVEPEEFEKEPGGTECEPNASAWWLRSVRRQSS